MKTNYRMAKANEIMKNCEHYSEFAEKVKGILSEDERDEMWNEFVGKYQFEKI